MLAEWLQVKIDPETKQQLELLAKSSERTMSSYVRWLIKREWERSARAEQLIPQAKDGKPQDTTS